MAISIHINGQNSQIQIGTKLIIIYHEPKPKIGLNNEDTNKKTNNGYKINKYLTNCFKNKGALIFLIVLSLIVNMVLICTFFHKKPNHILEYNIYWKMNGKDFNRALKLQKILQNQSLLIKDCKNGIDNTCFIDFSIKKKSVRFISSYFIDKKKHFQIIIRRKVIFITL